MAPLFLGIAFPLLYSFTAEQRRKNVHHISSETGRAQHSYLRADSVSMPDIGLHFVYFIPRNSIIFALQIVKISNLRCHYQTQIPVLYAHKEGL